MRIFLPAAAALLIYSGPGHAALGEGPSLARMDSSLFSAPMQGSEAGGHVELQATLATGTLIREYVSNGGTVFAVSWSGPFLPDLRSLLGQYFGTMVDEAAKTPRAGQSQLIVQRPEVVIFSGGHMRAFEGRAWIPARLPAGFSSSDIH